MKNYLLITGLFICLQTLGQFGVTQNNNALQLAQQLTGKGVSLSNVTLNCAQAASGTFNGGLPTLGINQGVALSTGVVSNLVQPAGNYMGDLLFTPSDPDLDALVNNTNSDACVLEFDIRPLGDTIEFNFVFASEEYPEYVCSNFNDVFAFFLTGNKPGGGTYNNTNIALIPGTNLAVAINSVNPGTAGSAASGGNCTKPGESKSYSSFYRTNNANDFVMDGMTVPILAKAAVVPCQLYHLKFAIQDVGDGAYDSGVFLTTIKSNSYSVSSFTNVPLAQDTADIFEDPTCNQGGFRFQLDTSYPVQTIIKFDVLGTAANGVDFQLIPDSVIIPAGATFVNLPIVPIKDTNAEGKERVGVFLKGTCSSGYIDSAFIYIYDELSANAGPDTVVCPGQALQMNGSATTDFPWTSLFTFNWFPPQLVSNPSIANPMFMQNAMNGDTVQLYLRTQVMNCKADTDTVIIILSRNVRFSVDAGKDDTICPNQSYSFNILVVDSGGEAPFRYQWTPAATINDSTLKNPTASPSATTQYKVEVRNKYGCPLSDSIRLVVAQPPQFNLTRSQDTICAGFQVQLSCNITSGVYDSIVWSPAFGANAVSNKNALNTQVAPATTQWYRLTAYNKGCAAQDSILLVVDDAMTVNAGNDTTICLGSSAPLIATVTGNRGPISYSWQPANTLSSPGVFNPVATPVASTTYRVTASSVGCVKTDSVRVNVYSIVAQLLATDVRCFGGNDGTITAQPANGVLPYSYLWSNGGVNTASLSQLATGVYSVTVNDANGCTATASAVVAQPAALQIAGHTLSDVKCFGGSDGSIALQIVGGTPNYTYVWQPGNVNSAAIQNLSVGNYAVTITDANGCANDSSFTIAQPTELILDTAFVPVTCYGGNNGSVTVIASGGTAGYSYLWSNSDTQPTAANLVAGNYTVTVRDVNQCSKTAGFIITQPLAIIANASVIQQVSCKNGNDGIAVVQMSNGFAPFTYLWSNGQTTDTAVNLAAITYTVTITDINGCTATANTTVTEPSLLQTNPQVTNVRCYGGSDGSINSNATGGTPPYTYLWSNAQSTAIANQLTIGSYAATVTDANGCTTAFTSNITQPDTLRASVATVRETCIALWDGKLMPGASGGVPPYSFFYSRDGFSFTSIPFDTVNNLSPSTYSVRVTDNNNCSAAAQGVVGSPPADSYLYVVDPPSCYGINYQDARITIRGLEPANAPYRYSLNNDGNFNTTGVFNKLGAGFYPINIINNNGCDTTIIVEVQEPAKAELSILPQDSTVNIGEQVMLDVQISPYPKSSITEYRWSPQTGLSCTDCPNPVVTSYDDENVYTLTVIYNKGCIAKSTVRVFTEAAPEVFVPNMFSPNGDGVNDRFEVFGFGIRDFDLKVFNRWGEKVFESLNQTETWDGYFRNELQNPDAYVYYLQVVFLNNKTYRKTGSVTLVR